MDLPSNPCFVAYTHGQNMDICKGFHDHGQNGVTTKFFFCISVKFRVIFKFEIHFLIAAILKKIFRMKVQNLTNITYSYFILVLSPLL